MPACLAHICLRDTLSRFVTLTLVSVVWDCAGAVLSGFVRGYWLVWFSKVLLARVLLGSRVLQLLLLGMWILERGYCDTLLSIVARG